MVGGGDRGLNWAATAVTEAVGEEAAAVAVADDVATAGWQMGEEEEEDLAGGGGGSLSSNRVAERLAASRALFSSHSLALHLHNNNNQLL